ncbi:Vacuolar protein sorting-associated protein 5 [Gonapodya sp. JEL0774]|nr:Vacuolar protein sorting-associated protein 5 [Gonapodya sp. JEL0774]
MDDSQNPWDSEDPWQAESRAGASQTSSSVVVPVSPTTESPSDKAGSPAAKPTEVVTDKILSDDADGHVGVDTSPVVKDGPGPLGIAVQVAPVPAAPSRKPVAASPSPFPVGKPAFVDPLAIVENAPPKPTKTTPESANDTKIAAKPIELPGPTTRPPVAHSEPRMHGQPYVPASPVEPVYQPPKPIQRFTIAIPSTSRVAGVDQHISYTLVTRFHGPTGPARGDRECVVGRRYRDFVWLYGVLQAKNPGVIVPPLPEKQALGRFQEEFVESRRSALERCVRKMAVHPRLAEDPDLKAFLESESFSPDPAAVTKAKGSSTSSGGPADWFGNFGERMVGGFAKTPEGDEWFENKKYHLDILGTQLRALFKAVEGVIKQRKELGISNFEFGESLIALSSVEIDKPLVHHLAVLGEICKKMRDMQMRQARIDMSTLSNTADEYVRFLTSIDAAFASRIKVFQDWKAAESTAGIKRVALEKVRAAGRAKAEKLPIIQQEADDAEQLNQHLKREFEEVTERLRSELIRFDREKVEDFTQALQQFLEGMLQTQKEFPITIAIAIGVDTEGTLVREESSKSSYYFTMPPSRPALLPTVHRNYTVTDDDAVDHGNASHLVVAASSIAENLSSHISNAAASLSATASHLATSAHTTSDDARNRIQSVGEGVATRITYVGEGVVSGISHAATAMTGLVSNTVTGLVDATRDAAEDFSHFQDPAQPCILSAHSEVRRSRRPLTTEMSAPANCIEPSPEDIKVIEQLDDTKEVGKFSDTFDGTVVLSRVATPDIMVTSAETIYEADENGKVVDVSGEVLHPWGSGLQVGEVPRTWKLYSSEEVPEWLRERFILRGYRVYTTNYQNWRSIFRWHNETLNIHSHMLAMLGTLAAAGIIISRLEPNSDVGDRVIFALYLAGAVFCFGAR